MKGLSSINIFPILDQKKNIFMLIIGQILVFFGFLLFLYHDLYGYCLAIHNLVQYIVIKFYLIEMGT